MFTTFNIEKLDWVYSGFCKHNRVGQSTNSTYYYAVTIEWDSDGDIVGLTGWALDVLHQELDPDVSSITIGVAEVTSTVETRSITQIYGIKIFSDIHHL